MWPNARISVMGGEQAAGVLSQIQKVPLFDLILSNKGLGLTFASFQDNLEARGKKWSPEDEEKV